MAISEITNYTCVWDIDDNFGFIGVFSGDGFIAGHEYKDPAVYMAVLGMLRHESPLYYDSDNQWISAGVRMGKEMFTVDKED